MPSYDLSGQVAIVTGGGSGIGRAVARRFAREGCQVAVADLDGERAARVAAEITDAGGAALALTVDVTRQSDAARMVAERKGIKLPTGVTTDSAKCRAFLDEHLGSRPAGEGGERPSSGPSEKQIALARSLAERTGTPVPEAALASSRDLSAWIDAAMKKAPPRPPSEKQLAFAEKLAAEAGVDLPEAARTDAAACSAFIDKNMGKGGAKGGAPKRAAGGRR